MLPSPTQNPRTVKKNWMGLSQVALSAPPSSTITGTSFCLPMMTSSLSSCPALMTDWTLPCAPSTLLPPSTELRKIQKVTPLSSTSPLSYFYRIVRTFSAKKTKCSSTKIYSPPWNCVLWISALWCAGGGGQNTRVGFPGTQEKAWSCHTFHLPVFMETLPPSLWTKYCSVVYPRLDLEKLRVHITFHPMAQLNHTFTLVEESKQIGIFISKHPGQDCNFKGTQTLCLTS